MQNDGMLGGKSAREIAEQLRIDELESTDNLRNLANSISAARRVVLGLPALP